MLSLSLRCIRAANRRTPKLGALRAKPAVVAERRQAANRELYAFVERDLGSEEDLVSIAVAASCANYAGVPACCDGFAGQRQHGRDAR